MAKKVEFFNVAPTIPVKDLSKSLEYYRNVLGFKIIFHNQGVFAVLGRDKIRIGLQQDNVGDKAGKSNCYMWTSNVIAIYDELKSRGCKIVEPLKYMKQYKMNDFVIADPDGNTIGIGEV